MKKFFVLISALLLTVITSHEVHSQFNFDCEYFGNVNESGVYSSSGEYLGRVKPNRTDLSGGAPAPSNAYFPVLVVFVQFKNEPSDPGNTWPVNSDPIYLNNMIATEKNDVGNWWEFYDPNTKILSSHWMDISRGKFHVISPVPNPNDPGAFSVVLPKTAQEYFEYYNYSHYRADSAIHADIWEDIRSQGLTDWRPYDRWHYDSQSGTFVFSDLGEGDGYVDMIYKVFKSRGGGTVYNAQSQPSMIFHDYEGYNQLGTNYFTPTEVDQFGTKIDYGGGYGGSGVTISFRGRLAQYIGTMGHEHGHQLYAGGHQTYSRVSYGFGFDGFYSPYEMILNGYMTPTDATLNATNDLGDYSSRNGGDGELLKVPINGTGEFFLLASRNKVSKWDRVMLGDIAQIDPYNETSEYGKGLYVYHIKNGIHLPVGNSSPQDMECADGFFEWEYGGHSEANVHHDCFVSGTGHWAYFNKKSVLYHNDSSLINRQAPFGDGISFHYRYNDTTRVKWWGIGKRNTDPCLIGINRLETNYEEVYTMSSTAGDRYNAWRPGYNEVLSPYSSPSTNTWTTNPPNENSGIFIYYKSYNSSTNEAEIEIYKAGGSVNETDVLRDTPPSRPMGLEVDPEGPVINSYHRFKLEWNHNMEPDMRREDSESGMILKRYKIYRSTAVNMNSVPPDSMYYPENHYTLIATVDIDEEETPEYIDTALISDANSPPDGQCPPTCWTLYPVRYRVQAVDEYEDHSVLSDFAQGRAWKIETGGGGKDPGVEQMPHPGEGLAGEIPSEFALKQNFPNPFNPTTNIQFDLPRDEFVTIKIYDMSGRELEILFNDFRTAGRYIVGFNASHLASGVYFYTIKAGSFEQTRRMLLIK